MVYVVTTIDLDSDRTVGLVVVVHVGNDVQDGHHHRDDTHDTLVDSGSSPSGPVRTREEKQRSGVVVERYALESLEARESRLAEVVHEI